MAERETTSARPRKPRRSPITAEARENQMISLAVDLAERQLAEGTASSQVITHFLKLGSSREKLERERLKAENELMRAKKEALQSEARIEEIYKNALGAMRIYSGKPEESDEES